MELEEYINLEQRVSGRMVLLNAVVHRDYAVAAPIQIRVHPDRLLIWNPGELPEDWTPDKLLGRHFSQPYNPDIANAFFRSGDIEAWGRGIQRVLEACREAKTPAPLIRVEPRELLIEFPYSTVYLDDLASERTTLKTPVKTRVKTREIILELIEAEPGITTAELAERIGITAKGVEWQLSRLRRGGRLSRLGPAKGGRWVLVKQESEDRRQNEED